MTPVFTIPPRLQEVGRDGHCQHHPGLDWFSEAEQMVDACKQVCAGCPMRDRCLEHAIDWPEKWGIWGGTTPDERGVKSRHHYRRKK